MHVCQTLWQACYGQLHTLASPVKQQTWDTLIAERELAELTERQFNNYNKARLLAPTSKQW